VRGNALRSGDRQPSGITSPQPDALQVPSDEGRDSKQTHLTRARLVSILDLSVAALIFGVYRVAGAPFGQLWLLLPFVAFQAISWAVASKLQPSDSKFVQQFDEAVFVASWLLLPPAGVVVVLGCGTALGLLLLRAFPRTVCINGCILTMAAVSGVTVAKASQDLLGT